MLKQVNNPRSDNTSFPNKKALNPNPLELFLRKCYFGRHLDPGNCDEENF